MDWPLSLALPDPLVVVSPLTALSVGGQSGGSFANASAAWPSANQAIFVPFRLTRPVLYRMLVVFNGTAVSGNIDAGIYDRSGTRLVSSGSVAQAGTSVFQTFDIADTTVGPGVFYLALALSNATGQVFRLPGNPPVMRLLGMAQMAAAFPLPATATFSVTTIAYIPMVAATTRTFA